MFILLEKIGTEWCTPNGFFSSLEFDTYEAAEEFCAEEDMPDAGIFELKGFL